MCANASAVRYFAKDKKGSCQWIYSFYLHIITHSVQAVRKTGLHPHDPGCQQASAEVSLSKTPQRHQLKASVVQPSLTSDLTLSASYASLFNKGRTGAFIITCNFHLRSYFYLCLLKVFNRKTGNTMQGNTEMTTISGRLKTVNRRYVSKSK